MYVQEYANCVTA